MNNKNILFLVGGLIIGFLFNFLIYGEPEEIEIVIPSVQNEFKVENPVPDVRIDTVEIPVLVKGKVIYKDSVIEIENPVNKELLKKYEKAIVEKDSLKQLHIFKEAIKERKYTEVLEDSVQIITVKSDVIGTLKSQSVHYETKEKEIAIKLRKKKNSFFVGGFSKIPTIQGEEISLGVQIGVVKNKSVISVGFDNQQNVLVSYNYKF